jgi:hypothetical protein
MSYRSIVQVIVSVQSQAKYHASHAGHAITSAVDYPGSGLLSSSVTRFRVASTDRLGPDQLAVAGPSPGTKVQHMLHIHPIVISQSLEVLKHKGRLTYAA